MPAQKGRRKGRNRERRSRGPVAHSPDEAVEEDATGASEEARAVQRGAVNAAGQPMPGSMARATGALLALVTAFLALVMVWNGVSQDSLADGVSRIVVGLLLVLLAVVVGVLSVAPEFVRGIIQRRR
jgi:hypothetical protein